MLGTKHGVVLHTLLNVCLPVLCSLLLPLAVRAGGPAVLTSCAATGAWLPRRRAPAARLCYAGSRLAAVTLAAIIMNVRHVLLLSNVALHNTTLPGLLQCQRPLPPPLLLPLPPPLLLPLSLLLHLLLRALTRCQLCCNLL